MTGLSPTTHVFTVEAEDYAGNKSSYRPSITVPLNVTSFRDTFDQEPVGPRVTGGGWYFESLYGTSEIAEIPVGDEAGNRSLVLLDNDNDAAFPYRNAASAERRFANQTGNVTFESKFRISAYDTERQHFNMVFYNAAQQKVASIYYSYGHLGYVNDIGEQKNIPDVPYLDKWITVHFNFNLAAAEYELTITSDALKLFSGDDVHLDPTTGTYTIQLPTIAGRTSIDRIKFLPQAFSGQYSIDYLLMDNDAPVWNNGTLTVNGTGSSTADLVWEGAADDLEIAKYNLYADGNWVQSVSGNKQSARIVNLTTGTHHFVVEAEDYAGHKTIYNPSASATLVVHSFKDTFDGESTGVRASGSGWYIDSTYGVVEVVYDALPDNVSNKSLRLTDNDYDSGNPYRAAATAERRFVNQTGSVGFETKVRIEQLNHPREHLNVIFYNPAQEKVAGVFYSFGHLGYFNDSGGQTNIPDAPYLGKWLTIRFTFDLEAAKYDLTILSEAFKSYTGTDDRIDKVSGTFTERGLPTISGRSSFDRIKYLPQDMTGTYWIDYLTMDDGLPIWIDGSMKVSTKRLDSVTLSWDGAFDDRGVIGGYKLYEGATLLGAVDGDIRSLSLHNLNVGSHTFRVEALDELGNESNGGPLTTAIILAPASGVPVPPEEHPRLLIRGSDIPELRQKVTDPDMQAAWGRIVYRSQSSQDGSLPPINPNVYSTNFNSALLESIEAKALMYLLQEDEELGKDAIAMVGNYLDTVNFSANYDAYFKSKYAGQAMTSAAIVYDWCYALLSEEEKATLIDRIISLTRYFEFGYPPAFRSYVSGHDNEANTFIDLLSFGVAVFDEKDDVYLDIADSLINDFLPVRDFILASEMYYQGDSYSQPKLSYELMMNLIFSGMGADPLLRPEEGKAPYAYLYSRRPDGQLLRDGDSYMSSTQARGSYWYYPDLFLYSAGQYQDPYLMDEYLRQYAIAPSVVNPIRAFLFHDPTLPASPLSELPLTKYFGSPYGSMIARTGWGDEVGTSDVIAEMKIKEYQFNNHSHLDSGAFQIYYKGSLAIDSGIYNGVGSAYGSSHDINYHKRTIAHNAMLIYDPEEDFDFYGNPISNDGGQQWINGSAVAKNVYELQNDYKVAEVLAHATGADEWSPDFSYLKGDLAAAYSGKAESYTRSFMFLNLKDSRHPAAMIVYDKVKATNPDNTKYWLLHSTEEPVVDGNTTTITKSGHGNNGKLVNTALLPVLEEATTEVIGGEGHEFDVFGTNYPAVPTNNNTSDEPGAWRIQISPNTHQADDTFLNVIQVMDNTNGPEPLVPAIIESTDLVGAKIADRVVLFGKGDTKLSGSVTFQVYGEEDHLSYVVTDLAAGFWTIERNGQTALTQVEVTSEGSVLQFEGPPAEYVLTRSAERTLPADQKPSWSRVADVSAMNISASGTTLSWTGAEAGGAPIAAYRIYESGKLLAIVSGSTYSAAISGLTPGYHTFRIEAVDTSGLLSNTGPSVTVSLQERFTVTGVVYQGGVGPLAGASVTIRTQLDGTVVGKATTAGDGSFTLIDLIAGNYILDTSNAGSSSDTRSITVPSENPAQTITLLPKLAITAVTASMEPEGLATNTIDGSIIDGSTWQGSGDGVWIQYDFGESKLVSRADIVWYQSIKQRITYDIAVSTDGVTFTTVFSGQSSIASGFQITSFDPVTARYIRIIGHGNDGPYSAWTSINEVAFYLQS
ncbi:heparin/heparin-sulfate lyase HepB [Paenibacillus koleovorans]|uniref:heparin/heparin-sulfate lyase HepB n=1 Tax=Paenibacillus koleovorans TaxID=121608 RepID=UPI001C3FCBAC|nr:heparin/heparin-sulfate lyase HepB [Paenibacillus koleovorans]